MLQLETNPTLRALSAPSAGAAVPSRGRVEWAILAGDLGVMALVLLAIGFAPGPAALAQLTTAGFVIASCFLLGHYTTRKPFRLEAGQALLSTVGALALVLSGCALLDRTASGARSVVFAAAVCLALIAGRALLKSLLHRAGVWRIPTLLVGSPGSFADLRLATDQNWYAGYVIEETIDLAQPLEASIAALDRRLADPRVGHVIIVFDVATCAAAQVLADRLDRLSSKTYSLVPPIRGLSFARLSLQRPFGHDGVMLHRDRTASRCSHALKRAIDVVLASILLLALSPLLLLIGTIVRADGGPAIYRSPRIGRNGHAFEAYKFRSMVPDAEKILQRLLASDPAARREWEKQYKLKRDPRITPMGRILRTTSLDELPQLVNVLKGEMSLVGPRPILPEELASYREALAVYHESMPGMTGMWQVCGRDTVAYHRRIHLNTWYYRNETLWNDLIILFRTAVIVFRRIGSS